MVAGERLPRRLVRGELGDAAAMGEECFYGQPETQTRRASVRNRGGIYREMLFECVECGSG